MNKYFGSWNKYEELEPAFAEQNYRQPHTPIPNFPTEADILFASYGGAAYEGDAIVIYHQDGKLFEVHGGHCSCYGLEGQWEPEETSWAALALRERPTENYHFLHDHDAEAVGAYWELVDKGPA